MFKFEVVIGTKAHSEVLSKILDLASKDKEVVYEENPSTQIAAGYAKP